MAGQGILCRIIHRESPTPLIMYTVAAYGLPYGMAITASHNPAVYNGIKVFMEGGRDADETLTAAFEGYIRELEGEPVETVPYEEGLAAGSIQLIDPMNDYIDSILKWWMQRPSGPAACTWCWTPCTACPRQRCRPSCSPPGAT